MQTVSRNIFKNYLQYGFFSARTCGVPGVVPNGWHQGDCSDFGCRVFYKCSEGFELIGKSERLCHSDGYWVPKDLPACVRKYFNAEFARAGRSLPRSVTIPDGGWWVCVYVGGEQPIIMKLLSCPHFSRRRR